MQILLVFLVLFGTLSNVSSWKPDPVKMELQEAPDDSSPEDSEDKINELDLILHNSQQQLYSYSTSKIFNHHLHFLTAHFTSNVSTPPPELELLISA